MGQGFKPPVSLLQSRVGMQGTCEEEGTEAVATEEKRLPMESEGPLLSGCGKEEERGHEWCLLGQLRRWWCLSTRHSFEGGGGVGVRKITVTFGRVEFKMPAAHSDGDIQ